MALEIARSVQSRFVLTPIARVLPGLETKHAYARRARNAPTLGRDFTLRPSGQSDSAAHPHLNLTHDWSAVRRSRKSESNGQTGHPFA